MARVWRAEWDSGYHEAWLRRAAGDGAPDVGFRQDLAVLDQCQSGAGAGSEEIRIRGLWVGRAPPS